jgi:FKBP-type peptidyl-prolyl cis-trans isomerase
MRTLIAAALLATACAGDGGAAILTTDYAPFLLVDFDQSTKLSNGEYIRDLAAGTGAPIRQGQTLSGSFNAWLPDGTLVITNDGTGEPSDVILGDPTIIAGFNQGLGGMNVGGTRQLIIPPELGYGDQGVSGDIPGGAILVYQVQVTAAR